MILEVSSGELQLDVQLENQGKDFCVTRDENTNVCTENDPKPNIENVMSNDRMPS